MKLSQGKKMSVSSKVINPKSLVHRENMKTSEDITQRSALGDESE